MKSLVIYATRCGNTRTIAEAIAATLRERGTAEVFDVERAPATLPQSDLIFIGGPTERHTLTPPVARFFDGLARGSLSGKAAVAFDTRMQWPRFLSGSAADEIAGRLRAADAHLVAQPESFFVRTDAQGGYELVRSARAGAWAAEIADQVSAPAAAVLRAR
jgi:flavodoxin